MKKKFTIKPVLIALLAMISYTMQAKTIKYTTDDGFTYSLNTKTQEASFDKYSGDATEIIIPDTIISYKVTRLGGYCFEGCISLKSIKIPASMTSVGDCCFAGCNSLESIVVDENNPKYDSREGCNAIIETDSNTMITGCKSTKIPKSVTKLGDRCFYYCISLKQIEIPTSVTSLGQACFSNCQLLKSIEIPVSVTSLPDNCFSKCQSLRSIVIPASVASLGNQCFYNCELRQLEIPASVTSLGEECFRECDELKSIEILGSLTSLPDRCFEDCAALTSIEIPASVTSLGQSCFSGCYSLKSIKIPASVTSLPEDCFRACNSLSSIDIPTSVTSLGYQCFWGCSSLTSVVIPSSVTSLGDQCFRACRSLTSVVIPSSVTSLGDQCFRDCASLTSIVIDANNPKYDSREDCNAIIETESNTMVVGCKNTRIPESLTSLGYLCFAYNLSPTSIVIPSSVTSLGSGCFFYSPSLKTVICKMENVIEDNSLFYYTPIEDATLYVPEEQLDTYKAAAPWSGFGTIRSLEEIPVEYRTEDGFAYGLNLKIQEASLMKYNGDASEVIIPQNIIYEGKEYKVTSLGYDCFSGCSSLTSVVIPSSVTSLGDNCFSGCSSLTSTEILSSVMSLGGKCFSGCSSLKTVICKMENVIEDYSLFDYTIEDATLYVPEELLDPYKATAPWSNFGTILPLTDEQVSVDEIPELGITLKTNNGNVMVSGLTDGTPVSCYTLDGRMLGKVSADGGTATFTAEPNSIVIVKVGKKNFKVYVK